MTAVALVGPTASGKSDLAMALAEAVPGIEICSVDSMSVYREMDIGTAKPSAASRRKVPHHLIDVADPSEEYSVARYQSDALATLAAIEGRGNSALLVGGTGLHLRAVVDRLRLPGQWPDIAARLDRQARVPGGSEALHAQLAGIDPLAAARILPTNARRIVRALEVTLGSGVPFSSFGPGLTAYPPVRVSQFGLSVDFGDLDRRIESRIDRQIESGWLDEVRRLSVRPAGLSRTARQALGYRELLSHLGGSITFDDAVAETKRRTRAYARRQRSWFRRDPRIVWCNSDQVVSAVVEQLERSMDRHGESALCG